MSDNEELLKLLDDIRLTHGYDFTGYALGSVRRRVTHFMINNKINDLGELAKQILEDESAFEKFVQNLSVNVTEMFRDPGFFKTLRDVVLPRLGTYPLIRIWLAGCSTGEEAYSITILLKELNLLHKSLIYATDLNPKVLEKASQGMFPLTYMKQYSENYIASGGQEEFSSYYTAKYSLAKFDDELRSKIIFSTHNLVSDHSFNEFQLILCRNVLIYFDRDLQHKVLELFNDSLEDLGYLALGSKETIDFSNLSGKFKRLDQEKIWRKVN